MRIRGDTRLFLISAHPVEQVRAPELFNRLFERFDVNAVVVQIAVPPAALADFVRASFAADNVGGLLLSIPHKSSVVPLLSRCRPMARIAGAANAVRRLDNGLLEGEIFDGLGFVAGLRFAGIAHAGRRVLIVGAGGAAAAIAAALIEAGANTVALFDPVAGKAQALAAHLNQGLATQSAVAWLSPEPAGFDLVINASPLGLKLSDPLPFDPRHLDRDAAVVDILMKNQPTPLLRAAAAAGHPVQAGFEMLIQQAPEYLEFFGYADLARAARADLACLRELIYPAELLPLAA